MQLSNTLYVVPLLATGACGLAIGTPNVGAAAGDTRAVAPDSSNDEAWSFGQVDIWSSTKAVRLVGNAIIKGRDATATTTHLTDVIATAQWLPFMLVQARGVGRA
ncbi:hypothetical protein SCUP234_03381 [Seiridium cupressi]